MNEEEKKVIEQVEWFTLQFSLHVEKLMEEQNVSIDELTNRMNNLYGYNRVLKGSVRDIVDGNFADVNLFFCFHILYCLNSSLVIDVKPLGFHTTVKPIKKERETEINRFQIMDLEK